MIKAQDFFFLMSGRIPAEVTLEASAQLLRRCPTTLLKARIKALKRPPSPAVTKPGLSSLQPQGWRAERALCSAGCVVQSRRGCPGQPRGQGGDKTVPLPAPQPAVNGVLPHRSQASTEWKISPCAPFTVCISSEAPHWCRM